MSRELRLPGLSTAAVAVNKAPTRVFARFLHFQLAIGAMSGIAAEMRKTSRRGRVHSDRGYASGFESVLIIARLLSTARENAHLVAATCLVGCFGGFLLVESDWLISYV
jgi:hypothetical protein